MDDSRNGGVLYIVGTPIGNLEDITFRAVRILKEADIVACEDTRQTRKLLDHYGIEKRLVSYHEHNESEQAQEIVARLEAGARVAQVSDAGMPGISDPGYRVVKLALERGIRVVPIPGPSALIAALAAGGMPTDAFEFRGFLPAKPGQRRTALEKVRPLEHTVVFYEAPHRIVESVEDAVQILGPERPLVIARELTKVHEEFIRGAAQRVLEIARNRGLKGEITLLIGKSASLAIYQESSDLLIRLEQIMSEQKLEEKSALKILARETGRAKSELYRELQWRKSHRG